PGVDDYGQRAASRRSPDRAAARPDGCATGGGRMSTRIPVVALLLLFAAPANRLSAAAPALTVDSIGMTVADMDRAVAFYTSVLTFEKVSDHEVQGREYE